jgi:hypothetical protein
VQSFLSLPQIAESPRQEERMLLQRSRAAEARSASGSDKPTGKQITNKTHPDKRRCRKRSLLLLTHSLHLRKKRKHIQALQFHFGYAAILKTET